MPRTSWVLPAPRSPLRPMSQPARAARAQASPRPAVSSALCEMNVSMLRHGADAVLVPQSEAGCGCDLADATQPEPGELFLPGVEKGDGFAAADGEEQFEILAISERGQQRWFGRGLAARSRFGPGRAADRHGGFHQLGSD